MHNTIRDEKERAILVGVVLPGMSWWEVSDMLDELALLADTAEAVVVDRVIQRRQEIDPAYFIGEGKARYLSTLVKEWRADLVIFDEDLSPAQVRNLERLIDVKVIDRSGLILDIFARRARSREAKTQVELAQLKYLLPRLTRQWVHLSRQYGGIGTRGPGEKQLEVDRRRVRQKIADLTRSLRRIERQRRTQRKRRRNIFRIALVGYTNSGKSTLLNALTRANAFMENRLFATLDATTRVAYLPGDRKVLITDTVGFIRKLPHHLIASFKSTLEEAVEADLLLHVVDVSHPHFEEQILVVNEVLDELGILDKPSILVYNKIDLLDDSPGMLHRLKAENSKSVTISALKGFGIPELKNRILDYPDQNLSPEEAVTKSPLYRFVGSLLPSVKASVRPESLISY